MTNDTGVRTVGDRVAMACESLVYRLNGLLPTHRPAEFECHSSHSWEVYVPGLTDACFLEIFEYQLRPRVMRLRAGNGRWIEIDGAALLKQVADDRSYNGETSDAD